ncbi:MAG: adenylate kinase [Acidimicrobiales bacterium]
MAPGTRLVILGKQGAGKGTQAERLARHFDVPKISTGEMFRATAGTTGEPGRAVQRYMEAGDLVPDDVVVAMVRERLAAEDAETRGFLLDGFPRTLAQAESLDRILSPKRVDLTLNLVVPTEVVLARLAARRVCEACGTNYSADWPPAERWRCDVCGGNVIERVDDTEAAIARRLALYEERTAPLVAWYGDSDRLVAVDGTGPLYMVTARLLEAVEQRLGSSDHPRPGRAPAGPRA